MDKNIHIYFKTCNLTFYLFELVISKINFISFLLLWKVNKNCFIISIFVEINIDKKNSIKCT